jgi:hypothetical protein
VDAIDRFPTVHQVGPAHYRSIITAFCANEGLVP